MSGDQTMRCPECGEDAVREPPADLVPWKAHGMPRPEWSHRDGTTLCPVIGQPGGYQPAQPEPKAAERTDARPRPGLGHAAPDQAQPYVSASFGERLQAQLAARTADPAGEQASRARVATAGAVGRGYMTRMVARLGELDRPAHAEPEPEAGA